MTRFGSPPNPRSLQRQAERYEKEADSTLDPKRREQLRGLSKELEDKYRRAMRPKA